MSETVVTTLAKRKMLRARAGIQAIPAITGMAFGSGGVDSSGNIKNHTPDAPKLYNELLRKKIDKYEVISDTKIRYTCTIGSGELNGAKISEIALYDSTGDIVAMKSFSSKGKDSGEEMIFECDDTF
jgi:hypothetical protein